MLTGQELVAFLIASGVLDPAAVVDGTIELLDVSRRNYNVKVVSAGGPNFLVKQGRGTDGLLTVANEAAAYHLLGAAASRPYPHIPRLHHYDPERAILVLELLPHARSMMEYHAQARRTSIRQARALGRAVAHLHRHVDEAAAPPAGLMGMGHPPWVLSLRRPPLDIIESLSAANLQLIRVVQRLPAFGNRLDELRDEWVVDGLVHGDLRADNCVVYARAGRRDAEVALVDWELCGLGDTACDVGSVFSGYLSLWVLSIPMMAQQPPDHFMDLARFPLDSLQPAARAFWHEYAAERGISGPAAVAFLLRSVRYAAAVLLLTAFEQTQASYELTGNTLCLTQLSLNVLERPEHAARHLLGVNVGLRSGPDGTVL